jgi:hypothetical protein
MIEEQWIRKDLKGSGSSLIEVLSQHFHGGNDEKHVELSQGSQCPSWDLNQALPEYKSRALPLHKPVHFHNVTAGGTNSNLCTLKG